jgi:hypothetical protein
MKKLISGLWILIITVFTLPAEGQSFILLKNNSTINISGTSSLHDWEMNLKIFDCNVTFHFEGSELKGIEKLAFKCNARDLKSESNLMDKKAYDALKADAFKEITLNLISASAITSAKDIFTGSLTGKLSIAGVTKTVIIPFKGKLITENQLVSLEVESSFELSMADFKIIPPTAILGTLKTGDKVKLSLNAVFINN